MKIVHKYITKEFIISTLFGLAVFSLVLLLDQVFQLIDLILSKGISVFTVSKLFILVLPNIFSLTIPMSVLFGILLSFGRLSEDNEITALRSSGISYFKIAFPVIIFSLLISFVLVFFNQNLSPKTHLRFRKMYKEILKQSPLVKFEEKSIISIGDYKLYIQEKDRETNILKGVNIYKFSGKEGNSAADSWRISASSSTVYLASNKIVFHLFNGYWQKPDPSEPKTLVHLMFSEYKFLISLETNKVSESQSLREMTSSNLKETISRYEKENMPTHFLRTEYFLRYVLAFAPFVFAIIAIPLGLVIEHSAKSINFGLSLAVLFLYYILLITAINLSEKAIMSPEIILWLPDVLILLLGIYLWKRMVKK